ncbi:MAG: hypothetical protein QOJ79_2950 [Actinomycetota bacterium]|jgi:peptidoglycan/xylan/chitin deacetylase (PgdA/CDA1 family)|nr:hypothetical protein [Actinomycetota bacterium]
MGVLDPLGAAVVLTHHAVDDVDPSCDPRLLVASPAHLEEQIRLLHKRGYLFRTAADLLDRGPLRRRQAVLTFDDGFASWVTVVLPLLRQLGVVASFYVCPGLYGQQHEHVVGAAGRHMSEDDVVTLHAAGMDIGSHTCSHPDLRLLDDDRLGDELLTSRRRVESLTGQPCRTFAYPYGLYDERVVAATAAAGYELAFRWTPGRWLPLEAPRLPAPTRHGARRLALKLAGVRRRA